MIIRKAAGMTTHNLKETDLVGDLLRQYPQGARILCRHFGVKFLERESVKVLSLSLACILRGVSLAALMEEFRECPPREGENFL